MINISNLQTPSIFNRNMKKNSNLQALKNNGETTFQKEMSKSNTQALLNASTTFDTTIIAGAISWAVSGGDPIATIGGSAVAYAIGSVLQSYVNDSALCQDGSVISYNYALGVQQVWAQ